MFNEIDGNFDEVAIKTFKVGLPSKHGLRKSLTGKPVTSLRQLMDRVDKYKRIEDNQQQGKGKAKVNPHERRDFRSDRYNNSRPRRDYADQSGSTNTQVVGAVFREPVHQVLEKIKNEPFFKQLNKMMGNPESVTITSIASIIKIMGIPPRIAGAYGITWTSSSERAS